MKWSSPLRDCIVVPEGVLWDHEKEATEYKTEIADYAKMKLSEEKNKMTSTHDTIGQVKTLSAIHEFVPKKIKEKEEEKNSRDALKKAAENSIEFVPQKKHQKNNVKAASANSTNDSQDQPKALSDKQIIWSEFVPKKKKEEKEKELLNASVFVPKKNGKVLYFLDDFLRVTIRGNICVFETKGGQVCYFKSH